MVSIGSTPPEQSIVINNFRDFGYEIEGCGIRIGDRIRYGGRWGGRVLKKSQSIQDIQFYLQ